MSERFSQPYLPKFCIRPPLPKEKGSRSIEVNEIATYTVCTASSSPFVTCCAFSLAASCHAGIPGRLGKNGDPLLDTNGGVSVPVPVKLIAFNGSEVPPPVVPFVLGEFKPGAEVDVESVPGVNER